MRTIINFKYFTSHTKFVYIQSIIRRICVKIFYFNISVGRRTFVYSRFSNQTLKILLATIKTYTQIRVVSVIPSTEGSCRGRTSPSLRTYPSWYLIQVNRSVYSRLKFSLGIWNHFVTRFTGENIRKLTIDEKIKLAEEAKKTPDKKKK